MGQEARIPDPASVKQCSDADVRSMGRAITVPSACAS